MSLLAKTYDLSLVRCTVNGIAISGYGETDAVGFEWGSDLAEGKPTADGDYVYTRTNDRGLTVTITLSQQSRAYLLLAGLLETQHGDNSGIRSPQIVPVVFAMADPSNGESVTGAAVLLSRPAPSKNKTAADVMFKLHIANPKVTPPVLNVI